MTSHDWRACVRVAFCVASAMFAGASDLIAEVVRVEIDRRADVLGGKPFGEAGPYEMIDARIFYEFDPSNPQNKAIVDIALAPRNGAGMVEAWGNALILQAKDPARRAGVALVEVSNRGRHGGMQYFNMAPHPFRAPDATVEKDFGDGFLMEEGLTVIMLGWQFDVPDERYEAKALRLSVPFAKQPARTITDLVRTDWTIDSPRDVLGLSHFNHWAYAPVDPDGAEHVLTYRSSLTGPKSVVPRTDWSFVASEGASVGPLTAIRSRSGFLAGRIYELVYRSSEPRIVGLGLAAVRDVVSYVKNQSTALFPAPIGIAFGYSQTGRLLRHFLYQGFNTDEQGRKAYDGMLIQVSGAGRGNFNHRFAQPSRDATPYESLFYPVDIFPFNSRPQRDAQTGTEDGLLSHQREDHLPLIFQTNSSYEYWGRAASLIHTSADGLEDVPPAANERIYLLTGAQHSIVENLLPPQSARVEGTTGFRGNPLDFRLTLRALTTHLVAWVKSGTEPPPSRYPRIAEGTLVPPAGRAFPRVPHVRAPRTAHQAYRTDYGPEFARTGIITKEPPGIGPAFASLVPQVDGFGNDLGGIRPWELIVPLGTFMPSRLRPVPWNTGEHARSGEDAQVSYIGAYIPLPLTEAERSATGDSRPSLETLYPSKDVFLARVRQAAAGLVAQRALLPRDVSKVESRAAAHWDWLTNGDPLNGTWTLNPAKSSSRTGRPTFAQVLTLAISGDEETYRSEVTNAQGVKQSTSYTARYDGKTYPSRVSSSDRTGDEPGDGVVLRRIDNRTRERLVMRDDRIVRVMRRTLSVDGRTLTSVLTDIDADQKSVVASTLVYEKR